MTENMREEEEDMVDLVIDQAIGEAMEDIPIKATADIPIEEEDPIIMEVITEEVELMNGSPIQSTPMSLLEKSGRTSKTCKGQSERPLMPMLTTLKTERLTCSTSSTDSRRLSMILILPNTDSN